MLALKSLIEYLAPAVCAGCGQEGSWLCPACSAGINPKNLACWRCNRLTIDGRSCQTCRRFALAGVSVAAHYDGVIKRLVQAIKYHNAVSAAKVAASLIAPLPRLRSAGEEFDLVVAVPTPPARRRRRGYNQAELIAKELARQIGLPYSPALARLTDSSQVGHNRDERFRQISGSFYVPRTKLIQGARILIVDDVLTTGATLNECAKALKAAEAKYVWGAVLAKH